MEYKKRTLIVSAPGGHGVVAKQILEGINSDSILVFTKLGESWMSKINDNYIEICESNRDIKFFKQLLIAINLISNYRPNVIISTGAGVAVPFFIIGSLFRCKRIYIESQSHVNKLSLTALLSYPFVNLIIVRSRKFKSSGKIRVIL